MYNKAQVSSQIFTYILAAIIIGILFLVGYKAIVMILDFIRNAPLNELKLMVKGKVSQVAQSYGKIEKVELNIPDEFNQICFIDSLDSEGQHNINLPNNANIFIQDAVTQNVQTNVFLMKDGIYGEGSFYVKKLNVASDYLCLENGDNLEIWLEGVGGSACLTFNQQGSCV
jgi:hypothetical protein